MECTLSPYTLSPMIFFSKMLRFERIGVQEMIENNSQFSLLGTVSPSADRISLARCLLCSRLAKDKSIRAINSSYSIYPFLSSSMMVYVWLVNTASPSPIKVPNMLAKFIWGRKFIITLTSLLSLSASFISCIFYFTNGWSNYYSIDYLSQGYLASKLFKNSITSSL